MIFALADRLFLFNPRNDALDSNSEATMLIVSQELNRCSSLIRD